uniref:Uncharacterized protein n=1 Tax=Arundo donax TaxID=35708 RepID=A0A0A9DGW3_ARUDO
MQTHAACARHSADIWVRPIEGPRVGDLSLSDRACVTPRAVPCAERACHPNARRAQPFPRLTSGSGRLWPHASVTWFW